MLDRQLRSPGGCQALNLIKPEELKSKVKLDQVVFEMLRSQEQATRWIAEGCLDIADMKPEVLVAIDDVAFYALSAEGEVMGILKGDWDLKKGKASFDLGRLRLFPTK